MLGVARTTVSAWEIGRTEPSATNFVLWAETTNQPLAWLAAGVVRPKGFEPPTFWSVVNSLQRSGRSQACDLSDDLAFWAIVEDVERTTRVSGPLDHKAGAERIRVALRPGTKAAEQ